MSGTPLPGKHWVALTLERGCVARRALLDWETARADDYEVQWRDVDAGGKTAEVEASWGSRWESLDLVRVSRNVSRQHVVDDCTLRRRLRQREVASASSATREYRLLINRAISYNLHFPPPSCPPLSSSKAKYDMLAPLL